MTRWLERQRYFLDFTLASLLRQRWKNISLLLVYSLLIFVIASVLFFTHAIRNEAKAVLENSPMLVVQRLKMGRHDLITADHVRAIAKIRGVRKATGRLWGYYYDPLTEANYTLMASEDFGLGTDEATAGEGVLRVLDQGINGSISLDSHDGTPTVLDITQALSEDTALVSSDLIIVNQETFRRLFGVAPGFFTDVAVEIRNSREVANIGRKIITMYPDARPIMRDEIMRTYDSLFHWRSALMVLLFCGGAFAFFIFAWDKATGLSVAEKAEIGVLKAVGWETADVLRIKLWEGLVISLTSFLIGVLLAYVHVFLGSAALCEPVLKGWAVLYPRMELIPSVNFFQLAQLFFLTVVPYTLLTIVPAWKAAIADPANIMR